ARPDRGAPTRPSGTAEGSRRGPGWSPARNRGSRPKAAGGPCAACPARLGVRGKPAKKHGEYTRVKGSREIGASEARRILPVAASGLVRCGRSSLRGGDGRVRRTLPGGAGVAPASRRGVCPRRRDARRAGAGNRAHRPRARTPLPRGPVPQPARPTALPPRPRDEERSQPAPPPDALDPAGGGAAGRLARRNAGEHRPRQGVAGEPRGRRAGADDPQHPPRLPGRPPATRTRISRLRGGGALPARRGRRPGPPTRGRLGAVAARGRGVLPAGERRRVEAKGRGDPPVRGAAGRGFGGGGRPGHPQPGHAACARPGAPRASGGRGGLAMSLDLLAVLGLDTGATLKTAYDFCAAPPPKEALLEWCEKALAIARRLDEKGRPEVLRATLEEIVALVEAHPASFAEAAKWADERWAEAPGPWAIRLLDALASAPELAAIDATEAASALDVDRLLASLPAEKLAAADEALRASREWKAAVQELFDPARATPAPPRFAAPPAPAAA